jgi:hypothetical protein
MSDTSSEDKAPLAPDTGIWQHQEIQIGPSRVAVRRRRIAIAVAASVAVLLIIVIILVAFW